MTTSGRGKGSTGTRWIGCRKGLIHDPVGKAKSVVLTEEGLAKSERLFTKLFAKAPASDQPADLTARSGR